MREPPTNEDVSAKNAVAIYNEIYNSKRPNVLGGKKRKRKRKNKTHKKIKNKK
jgi:hypothetical protein